MWMEKLAWLLCCWIAAEAVHRYISLAISGIYIYSNTNLLISIAAGTVVYIVLDRCWSDK